MQDGASGAPRSPRDFGDGYSSFGQLGVWDVVEFVQRNFRLFAATTVAGIVLAVLYILTAVPLYSASGQLLIDVKVPALANEQWRDAGTVLDSGQIESQIAVLRSEPVAYAVVRRLNILNDPAFADRLPPPDPNTPPSTPDAGRMRVAAALMQSGLVIRRFGFAYVLEVGYTSSDPGFAARAANAYMQAYIDDQISTRADTARQGSEWLERRINTLRLQMNEASLKVQEFKARRDYSIVGRSQSGEGTPDAKSIPPKGFTETLDELEATAMTYRRMFESALQAYTEAEQRQSYAVSSARVIATAGGSGRSFPKRKEALVVGAICGLIFGFGIALFREGLRFARESQARRQTYQELA